MALLRDAATADSNSGYDTSVSQSSCTWLSWSTMPLQNRPTSKLALRRLHPWSSMLHVRPWLLTSRASRSLLYRLFWPKTWVLHLLSPTQHLLLWPNTCPHLWLSTSRHHPWSFSFVQSAHWSHRRLVNPQIYISAEETSQMQVIVQSTTEIPVAEWIQEQSTVADLVNPQLSITTNEVWEVVDSFPLLEDNQIHQEQIVTRVQPHVIVHKNSSASN